MPIIIGGFEAQAIALEIESIKPNRPMTHDLMVNITRQFNIELNEVVISDLKEGVFYAQLVFTRDGLEHEVDSRPSDAIALAVRHGAPIFTQEHILEEAGITLSDEEETPQTASTQKKATGKDKAASDELAEVANTSPEDLTDIKRVKLIQKLTDKMESAINREDYELAARIRDEISRLEGGEPSGA